MRIIPKKTKVMTELFKGVSIVDVAIGLFGALIAVALITSNIPYNGWLALLDAVIFVVLIMPLDDEKVYMLLFHGIRHLAQPSVITDSKGKKSVGVKDITPFEGFDGDLISYGTYYGAVIEIPSIEFRFLSESRQNTMIERVLGAVIRTISSDQTGALVKIDRPIVYDSFIECEKKKMEELKQAFIRGLIDEEELTVRIGIIHDRIADIEKINNVDKVYRSFHYLVFFEKKKQILEEQVRSAVAQLTAGGLDVRRLNQKELAVFLKYQYTQVFDEREIEALSPDQYMDWILPKKVEFTSRMVKYDGLITHTLKISDYPQFVTNAWGYRLFNMPNTRVVMKFKPVDRYQSIRRIDRAIDELRGQSGETGKTSKLMELGEHIDSLAELLALLQSENETLFDTNTYVTIYDYELTQRYKDMSEGKKVTSSAQYTSLKKRIKRTLAENSFKTQDLFMQTFETYASSHISAYDCFTSKSRGIHSSSIAAVFPFVYPDLLDEGGVSFGTSNGTPIFVNFFKRDSERVNSNMAVIGKSGSGKSYATKTILSNLAADNSKVFILDPENEYGALARKLKGKVIDVGKATEGNLNPFHIITSAADEEDGENSNSFNAHLQFLEEFFRQILPNVDNDAMEYLNNIFVRLYSEKGIDADTDLSQLTAEDYPIFDDLYDKILIDFQMTNSEYLKKNLRILLNYISKFANGGRNSHLWNHAASIDTKENFIVFNFQSLLANKNNVIANAQMLLVLKWLDNEIIKNRDYNIKHHAERKIVIVIDEAHVFIDEKYPIALDFMFQLAKRIRKYNGMQIIITQNVKDFVGTEEIARKSTAIINACQYSFIFPLAPNDMHDLCRLYEKAGAINESEQEQIVSNPRGRAFVVTSPTNRTCVDIVANGDVERLFKE
ncbi:MAG: VirB4 family type IV secretion system protein [Ruminiclostridium sp.]